MYKTPFNTNFIGKELFHLPQCDSTNSYLMELQNNANLSEGTIVITDNQINGRGQIGKKWESEPEQNLTFSILLMPVFIDIKEQFNLSMAIAIAIADALGPFIPYPIKLKWPNDIYVMNNKLGGVLIENQIQSNKYKIAVVGIGINVNQSYFCEAKAISIFNLCGFQQDLNLIFHRLIEFIEKEYLNLKNGNKSTIRQRYLSALYSHPPSKDNKFNA